MISKYTYKGLTWVDLESPTQEELDHIMDEYSIPSLLGEELTDKSLHAKVDVYSNFIYLILNFPKLSTQKTKGVEQEIDFIVGNNFIITVHYEFIDTLYEFAKRLEVELSLEKKIDVDHGGLIFFHIVKTLYMHSREELMGVNSQIKETEKSIFSGEEGRMVQMISHINRTLLDFKQTLRFHKDILESFNFAASRFFGEKFNYYTGEIMNEYNKSISVIESHKEIVDDLRDTNDSLLANKTNDTIRTLTIITFLISPATVISSLFMMNTDFILTRSQFYIVLGAMFATSLVTFIYFKLKKWL